MPGSGAFFADTTVTVTVKACPGATCAGEVATVKVNPVACTGTTVALGVSTAEGEAAAAVGAGEAPAPVPAEVEPGGEDTGLAESERASTPVASPVTQHNASTATTSQRFNVLPVLASRLTVHPSLHSPRVPKPHASRTEPASQ